ncbi:MAG TPA: SMR family transporter [Jatrophihabitans sp.]|jgi:small multidrug resistance pump|nr:SMR family transporter [Jatrophihabitans sp.]
MAATLQEAGYEMAWLFLGLAIVAELGGTLGLRQVAESPVWWGVALIAGAYSASFALMWVALRSINVGVVYAIWSAVGTAAVVLAGALLFDERLGWQAVAGMAIIVLGVVVLVTSGSVHHS